MAGTKEFNVDIDVTGGIKMNTPPNNTGVVLLYNSSSRSITTRTNAQFITDFNLALKSELPVYTSSLGITKVGNDFRPTYGTTANTIAQGNDSRINNGQTAFGWGDFRDYGLGTTGSTIPNNDPNTLTNQNGFYYPSSTMVGNPSGETFVNLIHIGVNTNIANQILMGRSGSMYTRGIHTNGGNWTEWNKIWHSNNLTKLSQLDNDLDIYSKSESNSNFHKLLVTASDLTANNYYSARSGVDVNTVLGNISFYTSNNTTNSANYYHHISYGNNSLYGYQLRKHPESAGNYGIRTRINGTWSAWENIAYESHVANNYVNKSGDTMTGDINWNVGGLGLSLLGQKRLVFGSTNVVLAGNTTGISSIFLRPQGASVSTGQVTIDGNGQINTANHGNSSQWKQAYDWGDFRDFGLGTAPMNSLTDGNIRPEWSGFVGPFGAGSTNFPDIYSPMIALRRGNFSGYIQLSRLGELYFQTWSGASASESGWFKVWHDGNFNPSDYALASQLPTVNNGALSLTTGTGLSGSASFTANQSGNSSFSVGIASTHKLPTVAEWNALPTTNTITRLRGTTSGTYASGDLTLLAGANTTITQSGTNITIASTNTNTTYTAGNGLSLSGTTFGQVITTSGSGTYVQSITQTASGFQVNLGTPPNTNTTYSAGTLALLNTGTSTTNMVWSPKVIADFQKYYGLGSLNIETPYNTWEKTSLPLPALHKGTNHGILGISDNIYGLTLPSSGYGVHIAGHWTGRLFFKGYSTSVDNGWHEMYHSGNFANGTTAQYIRGDGSLATYTNTTYSLASNAELASTTSTTARLISGQRLNQVATSKGWDILEATTQGGVQMRHWNAIANKPSAMALGQGASATRINALAMMTGATADGIWSLALGVNAQTLKPRSSTIGSNSFNNAPDSSILGVGLVNNQYGATVLGTYNLPVTIEPNDNYVDSSPLLIVGNGKDSMFRSNSLVHFRDGSTEWSGRQYYDSTTRQESWFDDDNTLVDVKYVRENGGSGGGGGLPHEPELIPNTDWAYVGDTIYGIINSKDIGIVVCLTPSGQWEVVHGTNVGALKYGLMYGFVVKPNSILIRGYVRDKTLNSTAMGRTLRVNGSTAVTVSLVTPSSVSREDVKLGTVISTTGIIYFNPEN